MHRDGFGGRRSPAARIGISGDIVDIVSLPQALEEARLALDCASAAQPLMLFAEIDLPDFLIRRADSTALRLIPDWVRHFAPTGADPGRDLASTIRTFADCSLNVKQTAHRLGVHTNTVYFRLNRITKLTGIDPRTYAGASQLLTTLRLLKLHGAGRPNSWFCAVTADRFPC